MFTGIIQEIGTIKSVEVINQSMRISIGAKDILHDVALGDSIAINGVCLTVVDYTETQFSVDIMPETYSATNLAKLKVNDVVNLESSLRVGGKLSGHFVTGHVDGMATIANIVTVDNAVNYTLQCDSNLVKYCIHKGSIAVDGISLTIFGLSDNTINLALIPHTVKHTILGAKKIGDQVNIECDMLGKYVLAAQATSHV